MVTLFFDTEFTDLRKDCDLISIGVVADGCEDGVIRRFYAESRDFSHGKCSAFVEDNVLPHLMTNGTSVGTMIKWSDDGRDCCMVDSEDNIRVQFVNWLKNCLPADYDEYDVSKYGKVNIWSDCLAYDWVLFCHLFEDVGGLPEYINYIPFDICTLMLTKGVDPDITRELFVPEECKTQFNGWEEANKKHNSIYDALVIYYCYKKLMDME